MGISLKDIKPYLFNVTKETFLKFGKLKTLKKRKKENRFLDSVIFGCILPLRVI